MIKQKNVIILLSEKLEKMALTIASNTKSAITWGEAELPDSLREEAEKNNYISTHKEQ